MTIPITLSSWPPPYLSLMSGKILNISCRANLEGLSANLEHMIDRDTKAAPTNE